MPAWSRTRRTLSAALAVATLATLGACGNELGSGQKPLVVGQGANDSTRKVVAGRLVEIRLESNASTGYKWVPEALDDNRVELLDDQYGTQRGAAIGASGEQVLTFKALRPGTAEIELVYVRPWEKDARPAKTYKLDLEIEEGEAKWGEEEEHGSGGEGEGKGEGGTEKGSGGHETSHGGH